MAISRDVPGSLTSSACINSNIEASSDFGGFDILLMSTMGRYLLLMLHE